MLTCCTGHRDLSSHDHDIAHPQLDSSIAQLEADGGYRVCASSFAPLVCCFVLNDRTASHRHTRLEPTLFAVSPTPLEATMTVWIVAGVHGLQLNNRKLSQWATHRTQTPAANALYIRVISSTLKLAGIWPGNHMSYSHPAPPKVRS